MKNWATTLDESAWQAGRRLSARVAAPGRRPWGRRTTRKGPETVSVPVYAAVLHIRFVPKLNSQYAFAVTSMFAYWSIIMTYFGVNFYLSGMHSYAAGEPIPVPTFVWMGAILMILIAVLAYFKKPAKTVKL